MLFEWSVLKLHCLLQFEHIFCFFFPLGNVTCTNLISHYLVCFVQAHPRNSLFHLVDMIHHCCLQLHRQSFYVLSHTHIDLFSADWYKNNNSLICGPFCYLAFSTNITKNRLTNVMDISHHNFPLSLSFESYMSKVKKHLLPAAVGSTEFQSNYCLKRIEWHQVIRELSKQKSNRDVRYKFRVSPTCCSASRFYLFLFIMMTRIEKWPMELCVNGCFAI